MVLLPQPVPPDAQKFAPKTLRMSYADVVADTPRAASVNEDALVTAWMIGPGAMVRLFWPVGMLHVAPSGLQPPITTGPPTPPTANGRFPSVSVGTVMVR